MGAATGESWVNEQDPFHQLVGEDFLAVLHKYYLENKFSFAR